MNPKIIYPIPTTQSYIYRTTRKWLAIIFLVAAITSVIVNIVVKGKWWSIVGSFGFVASTGGMPNVGTPVETLFPQFAQRLFCA